MKKKEWKRDIKYNKEIFTSKFQKYFVNLEISENLKNTIEIFKDCIPSLNVDFITTLINMGLGRYNNVSYHNATHGYNTIYTGSIFLKIFKDYDIKEDLKFMFLLCCYLHDVGHSGLDYYEIKNLEFEHLHIKLINELLNKCSTDYNKNFDRNLINELVISTNLLKHEEILDEFKDKYNERTTNIKQFDLIDVKMLIKLADISSAFKKYKIFKMGGNLLEEEINGKANTLNIKRFEKDIEFMNKYALPLAKSFSEVFKDFSFLHENGKHNLKKLIKEKDNIFNKKI